MQFTEHVHAIKIPFKLSVDLGKTLDRFVYAYLIYGERICLIDSGVASSHSIILDYLRKTGRDPEEVSILILTHSHPDHMGGCPVIKRKTGCKVAAHIEAKPWIEDVDRQYKERPILNFYSLVEGPVSIDQALKDGDALDLGDGNILKVVHTPGHSRGSVSLLLEPDGALFSGDAIPMAGGIPIYEDVFSSIRSIRRLKEMQGLQLLLASWDEPRHADLVYPLMEEGLRYFQYIHEVVLKEKAGSPSSDLMALGARVLKDLGLPETALIPIFFKSIEAHLKVNRYQDLLRA